MRTDKPDGDELTNIEIVLDHVDADEGVSRRVLLELMKADTDKSTGIGSINRRAYRAYLPYAYYGSILPNKALYLRRLLPMQHEDNGMNVVAVGESYDFGSTNATHFSDT